MKSKFARPERSIKSEMLSLLAVLLVPMGIMSVFPYNAIGHRFMRVNQQSHAFASLVFLDDAQEGEAIQRARSAWQTSNANEKGFEIDLSMESLPELGNPTVLETPIIHSQPRQFDSALENVLLILPSLAAKEPEKVEASPVVTEKYFTEEDLMNLK